MIIRNAKVSDVNTIYELGNSVKEFRVSKRVVTFWPKKILTDCIKSKTGIVLVAEENQSIIGFIIANFNPYFSKAIIENVFVKKEFRNKNIGKTLLTLLLSQLKKKGCKYVCTLIEFNDKKAIGFYIKNGFDKGIDCVWLDKILSKSFKK